MSSKRLFNLVWLLVAVVTAVILLQHSSPRLPSVAAVDQAFPGPGDAFVRWMLPGMLLILALYALFASVERKKNALLVVISTVVSFLVCEVVLLSLRIPEEYAVASGYTARTYRNYREAKRVGVPFEYKTIGRLIEERRLEGQTCVPLHADRRVPTKDGWVRNLSGISNTCTFFASNETGVYASFISDAFGFANDVHDTSVAYDLVFIGDSFAHGAAVSQEAGIAGVMRGEGRRVLNLAISGSGPIRQLATYREYATGVAHDVVVWFFFEGNDFRDLRRERESSDYRRYLNPGFTQGLREKQEAIDEYLVPYVKERLRVKEGSWHSYRKATGKLFGELARLNNLRGRLNQFRGCQSVRGKPAADDITTFDQVVSLLKKESREQGARVIFVYLPSWDRYGSCADDKLRTVVKDIVAEHEIEVLDIVDRFAEQPDVLDLFPFRLNNHYNEKGYAVVAGALTEMIARSPVP